jgi:hypothetical protein
MRIGSRLSFVIRIYQKLLYPVAKPTALLLDRWLGQEEVSYFRERELREVIRRHMLSDDADLDHREGLGALNFLVLDDLPIREEGQPVDEASVLELPVALDLPVFPEFLPSVDDPFLQKVQASGRKWVILVDSEATPRLVLDADAFLRETLFDAFLRETLFQAGTPDPYSFCHRPLLATRPDEPLGAVIRRLQVEPESKEDDVIDRDLILLWGEPGASSAVS